MVCVSSAFLSWSHSKTSESPTFSGVSPTFFRQCLKPQYYYSVYPVVNMVKLHVSLFVLTLAISSALALPL